MIKWGRNSPFRSHSGSSLHPGHVRTPEWGRRAAAMLRAAWRAPTRRAAVPSGRTAAPAPGGQRRGFPVMRGDEFGRHLGINPNAGSPVRPGDKPLSNANTFGYTKRYADNWDRIFGKKKKDGATSGHQGATAEPQSVFSEKDAKK
ncbi:unnamed protein product [Prorocentrum cordatum]|uniref:Uncharacterized protein n=1 Tax=Prorocentrum cordatum TaxID=2364126 RepID=A0ABN9X580_9DINO|nr:unnamed protein product [Polarella glacialis]